MKSLKKHFFVVALGSALLIAHFFVSRTGLQFKKELKLPRFVFQEMDPQLLNILSVGHINLFHDYVLLWLYQNYDQLSKPEFKEQTTQTLQRIAQFQPGHKSHYLLSCYLLIYEHSLPKVCIAILEESPASLQTEWEIPFFKAFVHGFLLEEFDKAAIEFRRAGLHLKAPSFLNSLAVKFANGQKPYLSKEFFNKHFLNMMHRPIRDKL